MTRSIDDTVVHLLLLLLLLLSTNVLSSRVSKIWKDCSSVEFFDTTAGTCVDCENYVLHPTESSLSRVRTHRMWTATATPCPVNARRDQSRSTRRALNKSFKDNSLHAPNTYARHRVQVKHYRPLIRKDASRAEGLRKASHSRARAPPSPSPSGTVLHARAQTRTAFSWTKTLRETILIFTSA